MIEPRPHVALIVETSKAYGRGVLRGINRYVRAHGPWSVFVDERGLRDPPPRWLKNWHGQGIIARGEDERIVRAARNTGAAVVDLGELPPRMVDSNHRAVAQLAAEHLLERGFRHFAYVGIGQVDWSDLRRDCFVDLVRQAGHDCGTRDFPTRPSGGVWERDLDKLARWIGDMPKPLGVMACYDVMGLRVLDACRRIGVAVPEQVAVLGVGNDELLCDLSDPPLSSVVHHLERIGYEAAALLDRLMAGEDPAELPIVIEPLGIVTRQSTDVVAIPDLKIAAALHFIRNRACDGIGVDDVARQAKLSRRALERRFIKHLHRSPYSEIVRVRLDRIKQLLAETDFTLDTVATRAGFTHTSYMAALFKKKTGQSPRQYRKLVRKSKDPKQVSGTIL